MRVNRKLAVLHLVCALLLSLLSFAPSANAAGEDCGNPAAQMGKKFPVVLVHGLGSGQKAWGDSANRDYSNSMLYKLNGMPSVYPHLFDYSKENTRWVDYAGHP